MRFTTMIGFTLAGITVALFANTGCSDSPSGLTDEDIKKKDSKSMTIPLLDGNTWVYEYRVKIFSLGVPILKDSLYSGIKVMKIDSINNNKDTMFLSISYTDSGVLIWYYSDPNKSEGDTVEYIKNHVKRYAKIAGSLFNEDSGNWVACNDEDIVFPIQNDTEYTETPMPMYWISYARHTDTNNVIVNSQNVMAYIREIKTGSGDRYSSGSSTDSLIWINGLGLYSKTHRSGGSGYVYTDSQSIRLVSFNNQPVTVGVQNELISPSSSVQFHPISYKQVYPYSAGATLDFFHKTDLFNLRGQSMNNRFAGQALIHRVIGN